MATSNVLQQYEYLPYPTMPVEKVTPTPEQLFNYCGGGNALMDPSACPSAP